MFLQICLLLQVVVANPAYSGWHPLVDRCTI